MTGQGFQALVEGTLGKGGERFGGRQVFLVFYSKNITPAGISRYTDELSPYHYRRYKEGRAIFPVMPYSHYGQMDPEDIVHHCYIVRCHPLKIQCRIRCRSREFYH